MSRKITVKRSDVAELSQVYLGKTPIGPPMEFADAHAVRAWVDDMQVSELLIVSKSLAQLAREESNSGH